MQNLYGYPVYWAMSILGQLILMVAKWLRLGNATYSSRNTTTMEQDQRICHFDTTTWCQFFDIHLIVSQQSNGSIYIMPTNPKDIALVGWLSRCTLRSDSIESSTVRRTYCCSWSNRCKANGQRPYGNHSHERRKGLDKMKIEYELRKKINSRTNFQEGLMPHGKRDQDRNSDRSQKSNFALPDLATN